MKGLTGTLGFIALIGVVVFASSYDLVPASAAVPTTRATRRPRVMTRTPTPRVVRRATNTPLPNDLEIDLNNPPASPTAQRTPTTPPNDLVIDLDNPPGGNRFEELDVKIVAKRFDRNGASFLGFQVLARRKDAGNDGDGIDNVRFRIRDAEDFNNVYGHQENRAPFCAFQESQGTTCRVLTAKQGDLWRASDSDFGIDPVPFKDGTFVLSVDISGRDGESWSGESTFSIKTVSAGTGSTDDPPPVVTGCNTGQTAIIGPADGSTVRGTVRVRGTATCDNLWYYKFELEDSRCDKGLCFVAGPAEPVTPGQPFTRDVVNGVLMNWDTRKLPNGTFTLRLTAVGQGGLPLPQVARIVVTIAN